MTTVQDISGHRAESATAAAVRTHDRARWQALLTAMSKTGGAAMASGLLSALSTKVVAAVAGPAAVAWLVTLQQLRQTALVASTGNGQTALVRAASALEARARREFVRTALCIFSAATSAMALTMIVEPGWVAHWTGLPPHAFGAVRWLALPVVLSSVFVFLSGLLNALGGIGDLAVIQILAAAAMAAGAWPASRGVLGAAIGVAARSFTSFTGTIAGSGSPPGLAGGDVNRPEFPSWLLGFSAAVSVGAAGWALFRRRHEWHDWFCGPGRRWAPEAARHFGGLSLAMLLSGLAASGVLLAVRARITSAQGLVVTGQFDAAWSISMNYVTLVLASLQTYYLPALARARTADQRNQQISIVLTATTLIAAVLIATVAVLKPYLFTWLFSRAFRPGAQYLRWTLLGDYLKVTSWILSIPILAAADMKVFLAADLAAYGVFLGAALGLTHWLAAAASAAVAFVLMYAAHLLICAVYLMRCRQFVPARTARWAWISGLAVVASISAFTWGRA